MSLIGIGADDVLGNRDAVFRQAVGVEGAASVAIAMLFVRGTVTFDRPLVLIRVSRRRTSWLNGHHELLALGEPPIGGESNGPI